ncbi:MAG: tRNA lysidine(34) synthetase TilS [Anaerolineales bacterium]|nr:tRNA lysidine(34) synthetase TilS [Anaerolineales bacterium]
MSKRVDLSSFGLPPSALLVVGVSGGADSLCLLHALHAAGYALIAAHFNHKLRPEAGAEAEAVRSVAKKMDVPFVTQSADVKEYAAREGLSIEEAARALRYRFLFAEARKHKAQAVAVGHTADDQVETVLMHFIRGAGLAGLKGMTVRTILPLFDTEIPLIRPLLSLWRADTESYCRAHRLDFTTDASNTDQTFFRNRLRHSLIPELEKYNPRLKEALARTAGALQGDHAALQEILDRAWKDVFADVGDGWFAFEKSGLAKLSPGLRRDLIRRAAEALRPDSRDFGFEALERAAAIIETPDGKQIDFVNGLYLFTEGGKIYFAAYEADLPFAQWPQVSNQLSVISNQCELGNGWVLVVEEYPPDTVHCSLFTDNWSAWLDADTTGSRLEVRPRRAADRFQPLGMDGQSVKLSDFFVNVKLPRRARAKWPLVCAGAEIVWLAGYRIAHPFRITEKTKRVVHLSLVNKK